MMAIVDQNAPLAIGDSIYTANTEAKKVELLSNPIFRCLKNDTQRVSQL